VKVLTHALAACVSSFLCEFRPFRAPTRRKEFTQRPIGQSGTFGAGAGARGRGSEGGGARRAGGRGVPGRGEEGFVFRIATTVRVHVVWVLHLFVFCAHDESFPWNPISR